MFQFYIKIRCRYGRRKVGFFDLVLQIVTNFEKKPTFLFKPVCTGSRKHFCHDGHREIIIVVIRNDRVLYGLYSVLFIDRVNSKTHDKKDLPQNNGGLSISNDIVSTKIYDKRDHFDFEIVNFPFLDGDVPRSTSYGVYISQLIRFARASSYVADFNTRNKLLTQKLLKQGYRYHKLRKTFSKFYRRYYDLISKFQVGLKSLLRQGLSEPDFYGDLVYKLKRIVGSNNFSAQFIKIISHYKKIGYNINVLQQTACLVVNPITVGNFAFLFNCTPVGRTSDSMMVPT